MPQVNKVSFLWSTNLTLVQGSDQAYLKNAQTEFENHPDFVKGEDRRKWDKEFGIKHYAGSVYYNVAGFVDKNKDAQQDVFFDTLLNSKSNFVQEICEFRDLLSKVAKLGEVKGDNSFSKGTVKRMTNKAKPTVTEAFRMNLQVLVQVLDNLQQEVEEETQNWWSWRMTLSWSCLTDRIVWGNLEMEVELKTVGACMGLLALLEMTETRKHVELAWT